MFKTNPFKEGANPQDVEHARQLIIDELCLMHHEVVIDDAGDCIIEIYDDGINLWDFLGFHSAAKWQREYLISLGAT